MRVIVTRFFNKATVVEGVSTRKGENNIRISGFTNKKPLEFFKEYEAKFNNKLEKVHGDYAIFSNHYYPEGWMISVEEIREGLFGGFSLYANEALDAYCHLVPGMSMDAFNDIKSYDAKLEASLEDIRAVDAQREQDWYNDSLDGISDTANDSADEAERYSNHPIYGFPSEMEAAEDFLPEEQVDPCPICHSTDCDCI